MAPAGGVRVSSAFCLLLVASHAWLFYGTVFSFAAAWAASMLAGPGRVGWLLLAPPFIHGAAVAIRASRLSPRPSTLRGLLAVWAAAPLVFLYTGGDMDPSVVTLVYLALSSVVYLAAAWAAARVGSRAGGGPVDACLFATGPVWVPYLVLAPLAVLSELALPPGPPRHLLHAYMALAGAALGAATAAVLWRSRGLGCLLCSLEAYGAGLAWAGLMAWRLREFPEPLPAVVFAASGLIVVLAASLASRRLLREQLRHHPLEEEP